MNDDSRESLEKKLYCANVVFNLSLCPLLILYVVFATPLLGNIVYLELYAVIGAHCPSGEGSAVAHCLRNGIDIGELQYNYAMTIFIFGFANPFLAFAAIAALVPRWLLLPWLAIVAASLFLRSSYKARLSVQLA